MYKTPDGQDVFVLDCHTHFWDGSPANQRNVHGKQFIDCFYAYHTALSPKDQLWEKSKFEKYSVDDIYRDLFVDGPDDMAIIQSTYLRDFYKEGFSSIERSSQMAQINPGRFIVNGAFDPRDGEKALEYIHYMKETFDIKGVKMYTAEWNGDSKGWKLTDPSAYKCFELCEKLGIATSMSTRVRPSCRCRRMPSRWAMSMRRQRISRA
jgi:predicted TIM-barrel fold metal-dependent hydrolase